jgi:hypothetical protein
MSLVAYCPICGKGIPLGTTCIATPGCPDSMQHRCSERTLRGIDATSQVEDRDAAEPSNAKRLRVGFKMMNDDEPLDSVDLR